MHGKRCDAPIRPLQQGDKPDVVAAIMGEVAGAAERMIRDAPGQWMSWFGIRGMWEHAEMEGAGR